VGNSLCYEEIDVIQNFLNNKTLRQFLGVETERTFASCSEEVGYGFVSRGDSVAAPTQFYVAGLLERGIRVLIYAGTYDWICNWVSNLLWVEKLEWSGQAAYNADQWKVWGIEEVDQSIQAKLDRDGNLKEADRIASKGAGITKKAGPLTFASVWGAGHMISISLFHIFAQ
jgi:carboxypeptidase C (cathepsin A)